MTEFEKVLINRDGLTEEEAREELNYAKEEVAELVALGDYEEVEDFLAGEYGLEMDYIFDLIY